MKIGFIGTGIMGSSMAGHLMATGHTLYIYNRTRSKAEDLLARGAQWFDSPIALAKASEVIITIIGYPKDVEAMYLGESGILQHAPKGCITIDMTTSSPELAKQIANIGLERGIACLDAPVSGGDIGARDAKLSIMVGGDQKAFDTALPLFQLMGKNIALLGPAGAGQHAKLCNQIVIASSIMGVCEGLMYAKTAGLDPLAVLEVIGGGAAGSVQLNVQGPRMIKGDFAPGFMLEHFVKDIGLAIAEADRMELKLPGLTQAKKLYDILMQQGHSRTGYHALFELYLRKEVP
jgi:3-hydroxyisobutyrate dehydrogenase